MADNEHDWSNYWQGRNASDQASDEALVGVGIENDVRLSEFWHECFSGLEPKSAILDMACGAGSVLKHAQKMGFKNLTGVDISKDAISTLAKNISNVRGVVSAVNHTPLEDNSVDYVVSQFGFEYAGTLEDVCESAREMTRLLKTNGQFTALCHITNGGIYEEVNTHLHSIKQIESIHFIPAAKAVFKAVFAVEVNASEANKNAYIRTSQELTRPVEALSTWIKENQFTSQEIVGLASHLHNGTIDMFNRRRAFSLEDIIGWLDGMSLEIQAYKGRMKSMQRAALNEVEANKVLGVFNSAGFKVESLEKLFLKNDNKPIAWILRAQRS